MENSLLKSNHLNKWIGNYNKGYTLPANFYNTQESWNFDIKLFKKNWILAATIADFQDEGAYMLVDIGQDSIILIRNSNGEIKGFYNVCCHRSAQVLQEKSGFCSNIVCHYHQWTYNYNGQLIFAPNMGKDYDCSQTKLKKIHVENIAGLIFICLDENPKSLSKEKALIQKYLEAYQLNKLKVAYVEEMICNANWKLVIENNRECYHCTSNHLELTHSLSQYSFGGNIIQNDNPEMQAYNQWIKFKKQQWQTLGIPYEAQSFPEDTWVKFERVAFHEGVLCQTMDGQPASSIPMPPFKEFEGSTLSLWTYPNSWNHFMSDYATNATVFPISNDTCKVRTTWLIHEDAIEGKDYDLEHLTHVWKATNIQDTKLFESAMRGVNSSAYVPGKLSPSEQYVEHFYEWYLKVLQQNIDN